MEFVKIIKFVLFAVILELVHSDNAFNTSPLKSDNHESNDAIIRPKRARFGEGSLLKAITAQNDTSQVNHSKRNVNRDTNDRDYTRRNHGEGERGYNNYYGSAGERSSYQSDTNTHKDFTTEQKWSSKERLRNGWGNKETSYQETRHYDMDKRDRLEDRKQQWSNQGSYNRYDDRNDEYSRRNHDSNKYEVNDQIRIDERLDRDDKRNRYHHESQAHICDKPFVININSECTGPSKASGIMLIGISVCHLILR